MSCAALKRCQESASFNPADFEIFLTPPTSVHDPYYLLPEGLVHIGEDGTLAAQRTFNELCGLVGEPAVPPFLTTGMRVHCVSLNGQVNRRKTHIATALYVMSCSQEGTLQFPMHACDAVR